MSEKNNDKLAVFLAVVFGIAALALTYQAIASNSAWTAATFSFISGWLFRFAITQRRKGDA